MKAVIGLELSRALRNPALWLIATLLQCTFAWYSLSSLEAYLDLQPRLALNPDAPGLSTWLLGRYTLPATFACMLAIPILCMQKFAGDRQTGALSCLLMAPLSSLTVAAGKLAAVACLVGGVSALSALNVIVLFSVAPIDLGAILYAHACQWLYLVACAGIGLACSALCRSPQAAAFCTASVLMLLWLMGQGSTTLAGDWVAQLAISTHLSRALAGVLHTGDLAFFAAVIAVSIAVVTRALENARLFGDRA